MLPESIEPAKRTLENSPAVYCWEEIANLINEPVKRATEIACHCEYRSAVRFADWDLFSRLVPPMNRWAIIIRPLRGLDRSKLDDVCIEFCSNLMTVATVEAFLALLISNPAPIFLNL